MNWHSFIFSEEWPRRLQRHLAFWFLWWCYFTLSYFHYAQTGLLNHIEFEPWHWPFFIKSLLLLLIHVIACYYFIDYLMPRYLFTAKYVILTIHTFILGGLILLSSHFLHKEIFPLVNSAFDYRPKISNTHLWWTSITSGILSAPKVICAAAAAKLLKRWWLKQKEKERLLNEKLLTDLRLLKTQIHPEFLFSSLNNISVLTNKKDVDRASMVLLKLADILSYMLYECDQRLVPLEKELKMIKDYLVLQKTRMGEQLDIDIAIKGEIEDQQIAPLVLFSFIENSFTYINDQKMENSWINLEFQIEDDACTMKIIHGKTDEAEAVTLRSHNLENVVKQLDFFYPERYELKTTVEPEIMLTSLKIALKESVIENSKSFYSREQIAYAAI